MLAARTAAAAGPADRSWTLSGSVAAGAVTTYRVSAAVAASDVPGPDLAMSYDLLVHFRESLVSAGLVVTDVREGWRTIALDVASQPDDVASQPDTATLAKESNGVSRGAGESEPEPEPESASPVAVASPDPEITSAAVEASAGSESPAVTPPVVEAPVESPAPVEGLAAVEEADGEGTAEAAVTTEGADVVADPGTDVVEEVGTEGLPAHGAAEGTASRTTSVDGPAASASATGDVAPAAGEITPATDGAADAAGDLVPATDGDARNSAEDAEPVSAEAVDAEPVGGEAASADGAREPSAAEGIAHQAQAEAEQAEAEGVEPLQAEEKKAAPAAAEEIEAAGGEGRRANRKRRGDGELRPRPRRGLLGRRRPAEVTAAAPAADSSSEEPAGDVAPTGDAGS
ncbi:hypothetical protein [Frankia sp. AiPa1]|uniref:hypothetical protein n=1 Tax=Frankia sp. AiPa1 TaxID=573492 RepID=UPI00202B677C|nr:hypothetical protein [Frankia sp. AiPa1]MCL9761575.1 hypothetical protein [Frankia sp. AiPa1]